MKPCYYLAVEALIGKELLGGSADGPMSEIIFPEGVSKPTEKKVEDKLKELQAEYDAQDYARKRAEAYPSVGDQLDMIYKDMKNSTTTHAEAVEAVKTKYPKS